MQACSPGSPVAFMLRERTAAWARRPSGTVRSGMPVTKARLASMRTSAGAHSSNSAATRAARSRTARAVLATAGPALTMTRLPPVPMPKGKSVVSPAATMTSSNAAPSSWAQTWASVVAWPWPWAATPTST